MSCRRFGKKNRGFGSYAALFFDVCVMLLEFAFQRVKLMSQLSILWKAADEDYGGGTGSAGLNLQHGTDRDASSYVK